MVSSVAQENFISNPEVCDFCRFRIHNNASDNNKTAEHSMCARDDTSPSPCTDQGQREGTEQGPSPADSGTKRND